MARPRTVTIAIAVILLFISSLAVLSITPASVDPSIDSNSIPSSRSLHNDQTHEPEVLQTPLSHDNVPERDAGAGGWFFFSGDESPYYFVFRTRGYSLGLTMSGYSIQLYDSEPAGQGSGGGSEREQITVIFAGSQTVEPVGEEGSMDASGAHYFRSIRYHDLYPGIDLVFHLTPAGAKYDFIVSPGADPNDIRMVYQGANDLFLDRSGNLHLTAGTLSYTEERPVSYQTSGDGVIPVSSEFALRVNSVTFRLGAYDRSRELVIDPLLYSSYFGGSLDDQGHAIALDKEGNTYVAGYTSSTDFPNTIGAYDTEHNGGRDVFVLKLNPEGTDLLFSTFVGGSADEGTEDGIRPIAIALDDQNNIYVAGTTTSDDFPTTPDSFKGSYGGGESDLFVFKLTSDGTDLMYSTYIGGQDRDIGSAISLVLDASDHVILTGQTFSDDFPTTDDAYDRTYHGNSDGVIVKLSGDGSELLYGSYLGGSGVDSPSSISLDGQGCVILSGSTGSVDFPTTANAYDDEHNGGLDVFVTRMNSQCTDLLYSTFIGSSDDDIAHHHIIGGNGRFLITGSTTSSDYPTTPGAYDRSFGGGSNPDGFVTILSAAGDELEASSLLGADGSDSATQIALDSKGNLIVIGSTDSSRFPVTPNSHDGSLGTDGSEGTDLFLVRLDDSLKALKYGTFIGGGDQEYAGSMIIDQDDSIHLTGSTVSDDLTMTHDAYDDLRNGEQDGFFSTLNLLTANITSVSPSPALISESVTLGGAGFNGGTISSYHWFSSLDGELSLGSDSEVEVLNLSRGTHLISLRVEDDLGYWSDDVFTNLIVHEPPKAIIDSILPSPALEGDTIEFSGHGTDDGEVVYHEWTSSIDGQFHVANTSDVSLDSLSNGTHTISYRVRDNFGAWSEIVSIELVVNGIPRAWIIDIDPDRANESESVRISGNGSDDGSITEYSWFSSIDGFLSNQSSFAIDSLSNGTHVIFFKVKDDSDTWSHEITGELSINGRPRATIDSITPHFALEGESVQFLGSATDDGSVVEYTWQSSIDGIIGTSASFNLTNLSVGPHTIIFSARDNLGLWSAQMISSVSINGIPTAKIVSILPDPPTEGLEVTFSGAGTDDGTLVDFNWTSSIDGLLGRNKTLMISNLSWGNHTIWFSVQDDHGIWSVPVFRNLSVNAVPLATIVSISPESPIEGMEITFIGSWTDDGTITNYSWRSSVDGILGKSETISLSNLSQGIHTIWFKVRDEHGTWSDPVASIIFVNDVPVALINEITPTVATIGTPVSLTGMGIDSGSITDYEWRSDLQGILFTSNQTILTNLTVGNHTISFRVRDDRGVWSTQVTQTVIIEPFPQPLLAISVDGTSVKQGDMISISTEYIDHEEELTIEITNDTGGIIFSILLTIQENGITNISYPFTLDVPPGDYEVRAFTDNVSESTIVVVTLRYVDIPHEFTEDPTIILLSQDGEGNDGSLSGPFLTTSDLTVKYQIKNPDGDELVVTFTWFAEAHVVGLNEPVLSHTQFGRGDLIGVWVKLEDVNGNHSVTGYSDGIRIENSIPEITSAEIAPTDPKTSVDLDVTFSFFDEDDDPGSGSIFHWEVNNQEGAGWEPTEFSEQSLPALHTSRDQLWRCRLTPFDGTDYGAEFTTRPVTIRNSLPVAVITSPSPGKDHYRTEDILFDSRPSFDIDGDDLNHIWTIDDTEYVSEYFTLSLPEGDHPVSLVMSDGTIHTKRTFLLTITIEPRPDLFTFVNESYFTNLLPTGRGEVGREITFTVFVWNKGDVEASATVQFFLDSKEGTVIGQKEIRVPAKQWDTAFVSWNPDAAGSTLIIARIVDSNPAESDDSNNIVSRSIDIDPVETPQPEGPDGSAIVFTGAVSVGVFGIALSAYEPWKYRFFVFLIPLYTKLNHDNRMDNENRSKILGFVIGVEEGKRASGGLPGVSYSTIKKKLGFSNGALAYHLSVLEREGDVRSEKVGKYRLYFPTRVQKPKTMFLERLTDLQQRLVEEIRSHTEVSQKRLVRSMKESQQVISYNLNRLEQKGIIFLKKRGNRSYCRLNPEYLSNQ